MNCSLPPLLTFGAAITAIIPPTTEPRGDERISTDGPAVLSGPMPAGDLEYTRAVDLYYAGL